MINNAQHKSDTPIF